MRHTSVEAGDRAALLWLPVGAGGRVVIHTSAWWERANALRERRPAAPLFHAALDISLGGVPYVIEMTPAWGSPGGDRGVVASGPVGLRALGRSRFFCYEIRCWAHGDIPDRAWAVGDPVVLTCDTATVTQMVRSVHLSPTPTCGRQVPGSADMWNSNSLVEWLLRASGLGTEHRPPGGGRAPGWAAGEFLAG